MAETINFRNFFESVDPINVADKRQFNSIGDVLTVLLGYIYPLAGLLLFGYLILGGFELLTSAGNPEKVKAGQGKITSALAGFIIIFVSYWLIQIIQTILGLDSIFQ